MRIKMMMMSKEKTTTEQMKKASQHNSYMHIEIRNQQKNSGTEQDWTRDQEQGVTGWPARFIAALSSYLFFTKHLQAGCICLFSPRNGSLGRAF